MTNADEMGGVSPVKGADVTAGDALLTTAC